MEIIQPDISSGKCKICGENAIVTLFGRLYFCEKCFVMVKEQLKNFDLNIINQLRLKRIKIQSFLNKNKETLAELLYEAQIIINKESK